jgi:Undecaprenyl-phosphate galactose phosphotransferase WbaP
MSISSEARRSLGLRDGNTKLAYVHPNPRSVAKRTLDIFVALSALIFLAPMMIVIALLIKNKDGGPSLFKQKRIGLNGEEFLCLKFRSMVTNATEELDKVLRSDPEAAAEWARDQKLRNDPRITAVGRFIRKTSLDELPQLLNILKGEMSIIGPRPIVNNEIEKYGSFFNYYASVKPGVTGLWQISGRNDTTYEERVQLDVEYAKKWSFWLDLKILVMTIPAVLHSKGAY